MHRFTIALAAIVMALGMALGALLIAAPEAKSAIYRQVVDNAAGGRFAAPDWITSSYSPDRYGGDYRAARPSTSGKAARFRVKIPATGYYTIYAYWPANGGYNAATRFGVRTVDGVRWVGVNQQRNGGKWNRLGAFKMQAGDRYSVWVSRRARGDKYVVADAIKVVRGAVKETDSGGSGGSTEGQVTGHQIVKQAQTWLGVPYRYGGTSRSGVDCSGLTLMVYRKFGISLPRTAYDQYHSGPGTKVDKSRLGRGFLVFGYANGYGQGIQHVGILTGDGRMIHSPAPGSVVRYDDARASWYNIVGVKRIVPAG